MIILRKGEQKRTELEILINQESTDIIGVTAVLPKRRFLDLVEAIVLLNEYMFLNSMEEGRGVVLYTKKKYSASSFVIETNFQESVFCKINLKRGDDILVGCIYISPRVGKKSLRN